MAGSKMCAPRCRSTANPASAAVRIGKAARIRIPVTRMFQVKIGIRNIVIPGARSTTTVVIMLTAPKIVPSPDTIRPMIHRSAPTPGECSASVNGLYPVHPKSAAPPGVRNPARTMIDPNRYSQYANAFNRGNATSGEPICSGRM